MSDKKNNAKHHVGSNIQKRKCEVINLHYDKIIIAGTKRRSQATSAG